MTNTALQTPETQKERDVSLVRRLMFPEASDDELRLALLVCQKYGLDPLLRHVVLIKQRARDNQPEKRNLYVTRDGLLHIAHQSEKLDGIVLEGDVTETKDEWRCRVSVHRKDMSKPFTYPGRYPKAGQNARYGPEMAVKVAEVMALRRAFDVALPAREEQTDEALDVDLGDRPEVQGGEATGASVHEAGHEAAAPSPSLSDDRKTAMQKLNAAIQTSGQSSKQINSLAQLLFGPEATIASLTSDQVERLASELDALPKAATA